MVADTNLLTGLADGFPLAQRYLGFPKLVNDFFGMVQISSGAFLVLSIWTRYFRLGPICVTHNSDAKSLDISIGVGVFMVRSAPREVV